MQFFCLPIWWSSTQVYWMIGPRRPSRLPVASLVNNLNFPRLGLKLDFGTIFSTWLLITNLKTWPTPLYWRLFNTVSIKLIVHVIFPMTVFEALPTAPLPAYHNFCQSRKRLPVSFMNNWPLLYTRQASRQTLIDQFNTFSINHRLDTTTQ